MDGNQRYIGDSADSSDGRTAPDLPTPQANAEPKRSGIDADALGIGDSTKELNVFGSGGDVHFNTVGWVEAVVFMVKMTLGLGVLSIPDALYQLGAVAGSIMIVFWACLMAYLGSVIGKFALRHPSTHTISDAVYIAVRPLTSQAVAMIIREATEFLNIFVFTLSAGALMLGLTIALNAISHHATCTVVFNVVCYVWISSWASIRKIQKLTWFAWLGLICIVSALLIVVVGVSIPDRPAAAPQTGPFDLGFIASPPAGIGFTAAWSSALAIFSAFSNIPGFAPVIAEMKEPRYFQRSVYFCMGTVCTVCLTLSLVMFSYTGKWVASPALGSAGGTIKVVAYAVALPGLSASGAILNHIAAKTIFVRVLRGTRHISSNTKTHWITWLACTYGVGAVGFLLSEAIPFFNELVSMIGALGFGPLSICIPPVLWFSLHKDDDKSSWKTWILWIVHLLIFLLGMFATVGGTYSNVVQIIHQYKVGAISRPFSCADNSGG